MSQRPASVLWAGIVFWLMGLAIPVSQICDPLVKTVSFWEILLSVLLVGAGLLWHFQPQELRTFYAGAAAFVGLVAWGIMYAQSRYVGAVLDGHYIPLVVAMAILIPLVLLAHRYLSGPPSRQYFGR